jgi:hypothetical protein
VGGLEEFKKGPLTRGKVRGAVQTHNLGAELCCSALDQCLVLMLNRIRDLQGEGLA